MMFKSCPTIHSGVYVFISMQSYSHNKYGVPPLGQALSRRSKYNGKKNKRPSPCLSSEEVRR